MIFSLVVYLSEVSYQRVYYYYSPVAFDSMSGVADPYDPFKDLSFNISSSLHQITDKISHLTGGGSTENNSSNTSVSENGTSFTVTQVVTASPQATSGGRRQQDNGATSASTTSNPVISTAPEDQAGLNTATTTWIREGDAVLLYQPTIAPFAAGIMLSVLVFTFGYISGGHYNPAISLGVYLLARVISITNAVAYAIAHFIGSIIGIGFAVLISGGMSLEEARELYPGQNFSQSNLLLNSYAVLANTNNNSRNSTQVGKYAPKQTIFGIFSPDLMPSPQPDYSLGHNGASAFLRIFLTEAIFSAALITVVLHTCYSKNRNNQTYGFSIGMCLTCCLFAVGGIRGGVFNPALAAALHLWRCFLTHQCDFHFTWVYFAGPAAGAFAAALFFKMVHPEHNTAEQQEDNLY